MVTGLLVAEMDPSVQAVAGLMLRYLEPNARGYRRGLRPVWQWCADHRLEPLAVGRPHLELSRGS